MGPDHPGLLVGSGDGLGHRRSGCPALFTSVFFFGTWLGALGGGLAVPYVGILTSGMGEAIIIDAFIVAVIGGLGSLKGAFAGALIIGVLTAFGTRFFPAFDMFLTFIFMAGGFALAAPGSFWRGPIDPLMKLKTGQILVMASLLLLLVGIGLFTRPVHGLPDHAGDDLRDLRLGL